MNKNIIILICLLLVWTACKKKKTEAGPVPKQYSTWIVNNHDTFRTNNVDSQITFNPDHSYGGAVLESNDAYNWFSLAFLLDYFPTSGAYRIFYTTVPLNNITCAIKLYYNNQYYYHLSSHYDSIYASVENYKIKYTLPSCWFANYDNPTGDSILIQGTFNLP